MKKTFFGGYNIFIRNGKEKVKKDLIPFIQELEALGIGELVINSIDNDGMMKGYDLKLADMVREATMDQVA